MERRREKRRKRHSALFCSWRTAKRGSRSVELVAGKEYGVAAGDIIAREGGASYIVVPDVGVRVAIT